MAVERKQPLRKCLGCGVMKPKKELIRAVKSPEGEISIDLTGKKNGRGAYLCHASECLKAARKSKRMERAFACAIPPEVYSRLEEEMAGG